MASPRGIFEIGRLAPRSPQIVQNIRFTSSPKSPLRNNLSTDCVEAKINTKPCTLSLVNVDTPNRKKILNTGLTHCTRKILGSGGFGTVIQASYKGDQVAAKILRRRKDSDNSVISEKHATTLRHANVIRILGIEQGEVFSMITMELCGKSLQERLDEGPLNCQERLNIFKAITFAIQFCHRAGVVHADVKPKNILMAADGNPKLADFGSSVLLGEEDTYTGIRGTPGYVAPEVIRGELPSPPSDIYSLGILAWQMLSRTLPFADLHPHAILYLTGKGIKPEDSMLDDNLGGKYKALYSKMWSFEKTDRPSIDGVATELQDLEVEAKC
ncbi:mos protein isoform X1 [Neodiprion pinetum]|uniref:non-specific serine/threonine protein kinase n=2 Tax=Neodiprion TaxID=270857 RepID=A0A6J0C9S3_NEOLC|nr:serine/threonine-protein kinase mos [Neodiprion lecontei]XP_046466811.1 serine/threonine-protein kinase mos [Neodiprion pinetum]